MRLNYFYVNHSPTNYWRLANPCILPHKLQPYVFYKTARDQSQHILKASPFYRSSLLAEIQSASNTCSGNIYWVNSSHIVPIATYNSGPHHRLLAQQNTPILWMVSWILRAIRVTMADHWGTTASKPLHRDHWWVGWQARNVSVRGGGERHRAEEERQHYWYLGMFLNSTCAYLNC